MRNSRLFLITITVHLGATLALCPVPGAATIAHPQDADLRAQIQAMALQCTPEHPQCVEELLTQARAQAHSSLDAEVKLALPRLLEDHFRAKVEQVPDSIHPLPETVRSYFIRSYSPELVDQVGWMERQAQEFSNSGYDADALFLQDELAYQPYTIAWDLEIDLGDRASVRRVDASSGNWFTRLLTPLLTPSRPAMRKLRLRYALSVRAPEEWNALQRSRTPYQALIALSPALLAKPRNKQLLTLVHETQHALDYLTSTPKQFHALLSQSAELIAAESQTRWESVAQLALATQSPCQAQSTVTSEQLRRLRSRYFAGLDLIGPLYFSAVEQSALAREAHFARTELKLSREAFVAHRMPEGAISLRDFATLLQDTTQCALNTERALELYPVPNFLPDYFARLFDSE